jgi:hypothetical protein
MEGIMDSMGMGSGVDIIIDSIGQFEDGINV